MSLTALLRYNVAKVTTTANSSSIYIENLTFNILDSFSGQFVLIEI